MSGSLAHIWRHPIKSHGSEPLDSVTLEPGRTMPWDRTWAVAHEAARTDGINWAPSADFSRGSKAPGLMAITASLDEATEAVTLRHPDHGEITLHPERDAARLIDWSRPMMPQGRAASARVIRLQGRGMTDTPYPSISVMNFASHREVAARLDMPDLDIRRWRGNLWLDGIDAWQEFAWIGKHLRIGDVVLQIEEPVVRCLATTANPDTGIRDADTLEALESGWGHREFGVYARVIEGGTLSLGAPVVPPAKV